ncbi:MAG TPA: hypothetical protein PLE99_13210 [Candidatus Thiothrix moscowensis]|uniref:hypothetical protein n=1 Tax=unclassified Thiothrix TaxID=2636184 RepID=UPI0025F9CB53|nr:MULTISPECIES: hypothetical protein [unclassified Thiothrix]HRJ53719.1 hypothetical protein [Candidatus Thiothrix moscowensis]HRJ93801.1 hypothetical protein [Candidatus Thiothrix moscowensis]
MPVVPFPASTQSLLDEATALTGRSFDIVFDASLPVVSSVRIGGREGRENHEIVLRVPGDENNYLIAWQAAFVLHQYRTPETERTNLQPNAAYLASVKNELLTMHPGIPLGQREAFTDHVIGGVLTQLRSVPIGMLIDIHLHREYAELHAVQQQSLVNQVVEHIACLQLTPDMFPRTLVRANQVMNATQALMVAELFDMPGIFEPYRTVGMEAAAAILLEPCMQQIFDDTSDRELIDSWGRNLGIEKWYRWV